MKRSRVSAFLRAAMFGAIASVLVVAPAAAVMVDFEPPTYTAALRLHRHRRLDVLLRRNHDDHAGSVLCERHSRAGRLPIGEDLGRLVHCGCAPSTPVPTEIRHGNDAQHADDGRRRQRLRGVLLQPERRRALRHARRHRRQRGRQFRPLWPGGTAGGATLTPAFRSSRTPITCSKWN